MTVHTKGGTNFFNGIKLDLYYNYQDLTYYQSILNKIYFFSNFFITGITHNIIIYIYKIIFNSKINYQKFILINIILELIILVQNLILNKEIAPIKLDIKKKIKLKNKEKTFIKSLEELNYLNIQFEKKECSICLINFKQLINKKSRYHYYNNILFKLNFQFKDDSNLNLFSKYYFSKEMYLKHKENRKYLIYLPCKHLFHKKCIKEWIKLKKICPLCRKKIF